MAAAPKIIRPETHPQILECQTIYVPGLRYLAQVPRLTTHNLGIPSYLNTWALVPSLGTQADVILEYKAIQVTGLRCLGSGIQVDGEQSWNTKLSKYLGFGA